MTLVLRLNFIFLLLTGAFGQISGQWELSVTTPLGGDTCTLELAESAGRIEGSYSGLLGQSKTLTGTLQDGNVSLVFSGDWPADGSVVQVKINGRLSGDTGAGVVVVVDRTEGTWTGHASRDTPALPSPPADPDKAPHDPAKSALETGPGSHSGGFHDYLSETFGPLAFARAGLTAAIDQRRNDPSAWGQDAAAFGERYGSRFGHFAIAGATQYGLGRLMHLDTSYHRCDCEAFFPRIGHALVSALTARTADGRTVFSAPSLVGAYSGAYAAALWEPVPIGAYELRSGALGLGAKAAVNVIREFLPRGK